MDVFEAMQQRHSYRGGFLDKPVPREDLTRIVEAGLKAPSGCNAQTTSFVIIDYPERMAELREIIPIKSPAAIACVVDSQPVYKGMSFGIEDCSAAVENMLLAITALGYASVWLDGQLRGGKGEQIAKLLGVPEGKRVQVLLPVGVPAETGKQPEKKPFDQRAWFNSYEG